MKIEINDDATDAIVVKSLDEMINYLKDAYKEAGQGFAVFSSDPIKERRKVLKLIKAMKRTRSWYVTAEEA